MRAMRKTSKRVLHLDKEIVRVLTTDALLRAHGGEEDRPCISEVTQGWSCGDCTNSGFLSCLNSSAACASSPPRPF